jgi:DNA polymerase
MAKRATAMRARAPGEPAAPVEPAACAAAARAGETTVADLAAAARECRACDLWQRATQTVFGEGTAGAAIMLVGEQPGDSEDLAGHPFVGPAGRMLDRALAAAGIDRAQVFVTNVVKHFRWEPRGKWRIHKKPKPDQIRACRPWLEAEIAAVKPQVLVCLGATAAQAVLGRDFRVSIDRGTVLSSPLAPVVVATVHPSSLLRAPDEETRHAEIERFTADLRAVAKLVRSRRVRSKE